MIDIVKKTCQNDHFRSFLHTLITEILWGPVGVLLGLWIGSMSGDLAITGGASALGYAFFRTCMRVLVKELKTIFPKQ